MLIPLLRAVAVCIGMLALTVTAPPVRAQEAVPEAAIEVMAVPGIPHAQVWRLAGAEARPVVVILHGADGGDAAGRQMGPVLARLGYAAVGLPYYSPDWGDYGPPPQFPDLPGSFLDIRVDQLDDLRQALGTMPGVDVERFALFGGSKGSEFALIAASRYPWIDAVVAYTPSDVVWAGWGLEVVESEGTRSSFSFDGEALPFMPYRHENGRADHPEREAAARIPVEAYAGPLMLIAGEQDAQWNSARQARNIVASRQAAGLATEALIYPEAGHDLIGDGGARDAHKSGGTPEANAAARAEAWPQVVAFLARHLKP